MTTHLKDLYEEQEDDDEWILPKMKPRIGTGAGVLNTNIENSSDVINLAGLTKPTTHLCTKCGVEISFTSRTRTDFIAAVNTKYFNTKSCA